MSKIELEKYWQEKFESLAEESLQDHDAGCWTKYSFYKRIDTCLGYLNQYLMHGMYVLDAGCGPGTYLNIMKNIGFKVFGFDFSYKMVKRTQLSYGIKNVMISSAYEIGVKNEIFGAVIMMGVFQHLTNYTAAVSELYRCLKKDGLLVLNTLNKKMIVKTKNEKIKDKLIYSDPSVIKSDFERVGFKNVKIIPFFLYPKPIRFLEKFDKFFIRHYPCIYFAHDFFLLAWK